MSESISQENFIADNLPANGQPATNSAASVNQSVTSVSATGGANRRQKSWDLLDQSALAQARQNKQTAANQVCNQLYYSVLVVARSLVLKLLSITK